MSDEFDYDKILSMEAIGTIDTITDLEHLRSVARDRIQELENKLFLKEERIAELMRECWGRSSEKLSGGEKSTQGDLFDEIETTIRREKEESESVPVKNHIRKRSKRAKLSESLPRIETIIDIDEIEKVCGCGTALVKIGEDISEKLEVIPARFRVRRTIRPRYVCPCCGGTENEPERPVAVAPIPPSILPKTNATPSLLATIATWKFQDALPLHRQERIFARGGSPGKIAVRFLYHPSRAALVPKDFLSGYSGVLQTDGYESYDAALRAFVAEGHNKILHSGCMTHARRMFIKADRSGKVSTSAKIALRYFKTLYAIEREATETNLDDEQRAVLRKDKSLPVLTEFKLWLESRRGEVPPESLIGKAISYTLGQWVKLILMLGLRAENKIRLFVIGRKA